MNYSILQNKSCKTSSIMTNLPKM